jgi:hypothetical protein
MRHYCTIFDSNYLAKGLAMLGSLQKHSSEPVKIHVLAMDRDAYESVMLLTSSDVTVYSMPEFERVTELGELRKTRTHQEFCWTVGAVFTEFVLNLNGLDEITYIDADCFFFSDPEQAFKEIGDKSIAITPHRFAKKDEGRLLPNGKYAVQWVTFRGEVGRRCLQTWAGQVREWCFYRHEDGKFADQKYLDTWCEDYPGEVCEIQHPGVGCAPWNIANFHIAEGPTVDAWPLILYHFHEYLHGQRLTNWKLRPSDVELIYKPYGEAIERNVRMLEGLKQSA